VSVAPDPVFTREGAADRKNGIVIADTHDPLHPKAISEFTTGVTAGVHSAYVYQQPKYGTHVYLTNDGTGAVHVIDTARRVAHELSEHDAFAAHVDAELGIDPEELTRPKQAAAASAVSFTVGALVAILLPPETWRVPVTAAVVLVALALTGWIPARLGDAPAPRPIARVVIGGALGLAATYGIGHLVGTAIS